MIVYTDGGCNKQTGKEAWGSVVDGSGNDLLKQFTELFTDIPSKKVVLPVGERVVLISNFPDVVSQQNNGAELLALVCGIRIALRIGCKHIKCDSDLLIKWWSKTLKSNNKFCDEKVKYIKELISLRVEFEKRGGVLEKIKGSENKADLGYH